MHKPISGDLLLVIHQFVSAIEKKDPDYFGIVESGVIEPLLWGINSFDRDLGNMEKSAYAPHGSLSGFLSLLRLNIELKTYMHSIRVSNEFNDLKCIILLSDADRSNIIEFLKEDEWLLKHKPEQLFINKKKHVELLKIVQDDLVNTSYENLFWLSSALLRARQREWEWIHSKEGSKKDRERAGAYFYFEFPIKLLLYENRTKLFPFFRSFLDDYLESFIHARLDWEENLLTWKIQHGFVMEILRKMQNNFGDQFWISRHSFYTDKGCPIKGLKPLETLLALDRTNVISITDTQGDDIALQLRIQMKKPDNADEEQEKHNKPVLTMKKDNYGRICINDFNLRTPVADSPMDRLMVKLLDESKDELDSLAIKEVTGGTRPLTNIISDLGVSGDVRKLFFPKLSEKKMTFRRTITQRHLDDAKITLDHVMAALSQWKKNEVRRTKLK